MPIPTVQVKATINYANGAEAEGVRIIAELQSPAQTDDGYVVQKTIKGVVDSSGCATLDLWPNEGGIGDSFYSIQAYDEILGELLSVVAVVPESAIPINLEDIAMPVSSFSLGCASGNVAGIRRVDTEEGIIGGGDLTENRTHRLDLTTISTQAETPLGEWIVAVQDPAAPDSVRWARLSDLPGIGNDIFEVSTATEGQQQILIQESFSPNTGSLDVYINGKHQCPTVYMEEAINQPPYNGRITLSEPLEEGDEICIRIKKAFSFGTGLDSSQVTYSGGGSVEDALNTLFSQSGATLWQEITGDYTALAGDQIFVSTNTGSLTVTLPASPNVGDTVKIIDVTSAAFTGTGNSLLNDFTILRNGELIMELTENLIVDQAKVSLEFIYSGSAIGWVFSE